MVRVGVLLNPIAGFGGARAMHGTDALADDRFAEAVADGHAARRLVRALTGIDGADVVAAPGVLGASALAGAGIPHRVLDLPQAARTTRLDTIAAARAFDVDVLVFGGGDGTATDIAEAIGTRVPVIGVPSGVKMHSEVFARSPQGAGRLLADVIAGRARFEPAEVLDVGPDDETGVVGMLLAARSAEVLQGAKRIVRPSATDLRGIAREVLTASPGPVTWIVGPGATAGAVAEQLGFTPTLRGADVRHASGEVELDVDERRLYEIARSEDVRLVLGVVGGQGFLLGRGNQQLSPRVIDTIGADRVEIVATSEKVAGLFPAELFVDLDDHDPDDHSPQPAGLLGYRRVRIGPRHSTVMKVRAA
ncbi:MAG: ATP-NAD kinase family protein [Microbacteriaceae bacterium]